MFGIHDLALFIISGFLLNLTPGPDSILIMSKSAANGWRAGSVAAFGVCTGCYVHVFAAALGLSAILTSSATAFTIVKLIGAAYLVYMGLSALFSRSKAKAEQSSNKTRNAVESQVHIHSRLPIKRLKSESGFIFLGVCSSVYRP